MRKRERETVRETIKRETYKTRQAESDNRDKDRATVHD